jgi:group I intron endonuclease
MIIYKATNLINGKVYIGQTVCKLYNRRSQHKSQALRVKHRSYFYNSIRRFGWDNFKWEAIDTAKCLDELNGKEEYWIAHYKATNPKYGYNIYKGGNNKRMPQRAKDQIRKSNTGRIFSKEHCKRISESKKGVSVHTHESRKAMSEKMKGRVFTEEHRKNKSIAQLGQRNPTAKLTDEDVATIKQRIKNGDGNREIAKDYNVTHGNISMIRVNKTWRHIPWP